MVDAGNLEGDMAVVVQTSDEENGQSVGAVIDEAISIKRYYKEKNRIRLQPENPAFKAIYSQDVRVVGILSNIVRTY